MAALPGAAVDAEADADLEQAAVIASLTAAWDTCSRAAVADAAADAADVQQHASIVAGLGADSYLARLLPLSSRLGAVLGTALTVGHPGRAAGSDVLDDIAVAVASRSAALRADRVASRPIKKKALTDLLKALIEVGVSSRRSAVPANERDPSSWFTVPRVDAAPALAPAGAPWDAGLALSTWAKADAYYFRNMARLQARARGCCCQCALPAALLRASLRIVSKLHADAAAAPLYASTGFVAGEWRHLPSRLVAA
jgi:hypothetical protein